MVRDNEDFNAQVDALENVDAREEMPADIPADELEEMQEAQEMQSAPADDGAEEQQAQEAPPIDREEVALTTAAALMVPDDDPPIVVTIATNTRAKSKTGWKSVALPFDTFERRFIQPTRSKVKFDDYQKKTKKERDNTKALAGGFVGGELTKDRRLAENLKNRTLWNGDIDGCTPEVFERLKNGDGIDFRGFMYTTFSHSPESPRVRLIAPLSRPVTPDEYAGISPFICLKIERAYKCKLFDEHGNSPAQMMYNASATKDGEFYFKDFRGAVLDVDALFAEDEKHGKEYAEELAAALNVSPADVLPASAPAKTKTKPGKRPQDPRKRDGIPGLFNRAYFPINKAIDKFLGEFYEPAGPDRYTYKPGSASNGLSIMDGLEAYAWDETNKAVNNGHAYDAFELVTAHLYGGNDKAARAELKNDSGVKKQIYDERHAEVIADFLDFPDDDETPDIWKDKLRVDDNARYLSTPDNCALIIENDPLFKNIAFNEMAGREEITGAVPWSRGEGAGKLFDDTDRAEMLVLIDAVYQCDFTDRALDASIKAVTNRRRFHPFRQFLESLPAWDGVKRTAEILPRAFDAPKNEYTAAVMRKTLCAIIARTYHPGIKFDYVPVLDGEQGIGKTSFLIWLVGREFYNGGITFEKMRSKSAAEEMQGFALAEFQELAGLNKVELRTARAFITETKDVYRAPYDRKAKEHLRSCVFWGTVNGFGGYLRDTEGNRRYWPIKCKRKGAAAWFKMFDENYRLQLWAEAMAAYKFGEALTMDNDPALAAAALAAQNSAIEIDTRAGMVERYLSLRYPTGWNAQNLEWRINWLNSELLENNDSPTGKLKTKVCALEIWREAWQGDAVHMGPRDRDDIRRIMAKMPGWELIDPETEGRPSFSIHGQSQPAWKRVDVTNGDAPEEAAPDDTNGDAPEEAAPDDTNTPRRDSSDDVESNQGEIFPFEETEARPAETETEPGAERYKNVDIDALRAGARGILEFFRDSGHATAAGKVERVETAWREKLIAILLDADAFAASMGREYEKSAKEARAAGFRRAYMEMLERRKATAAALDALRAPAPDAVDAGALDAWRVAARAVIAHITAEKHQRSAGEIVTRYTQTGINGADFVALQNIVKDARDFGHNLGWGFGNACDAAIRGALADMKNATGAKEVLEALNL